MLRKGASNGAKVTLVAAISFAAFSVWGVHYLQIVERENMYKGVLRDDARLAAKRKQREEDFLESQRKRALYESVQTVESAALPTAP